MVVGHSAVMTLVRRAVEGGWLVVDNPGHERQPATYSVGVMVRDRTTVVRSSAQRGPQYGPLERSARTTDVKTFNVRRASATRDASLASGKPLFLPGSGWIDDINPSVNDHTCQVLHRSIDRICDSWPWALEDTDARGYTA